ncbi:MAG: hypothetical protein ACTHNS_05140 [Marmoricola sp.]
MADRENRTAPPRVAVGPSRTDAADLVGSRWEGCYVTSYDDLAEVDLDVVRQLGVAAGDGMASLLDDACARIESGQDLVVEVEHGPEGADGPVAAALAAHPGVHVVGVHDLHHRRVLELAGTAPAPDAVSRLLLRALAPAPDAPAAGHRPTPAPRPRAGRRRTAAAAPAPRRRPVRPSRRIALLATGGLAVLLLAVVVVAGLAGGGDALGLALLAIAVAGEVLACALLLALLGRPRADPSRGVRENRRILVRRTGRVLERLRDLRGVPAELASLRRYVEVLAETQALMAAGLRERIDDLEQSDAAAHRHTHGRLDAMLGRGEDDRPDGGTPPPLD